MGMPAAAAVREPVRQIGFKAHAALCRSRGATRPVPGFPGSGYLLAGEEIVWVGPRSHPMHPRAVVVEDPRARQPGVRRFDLSACRPWRPAPDPASAPTADPRAGCRALRAALARIGRPRGIGVLLAGGKPDFPLDLGAAHVHAVAAAYALGDPRRVVEASLPLLGFGPGLTPSGDDFAGAALFARRRLALRERGDAGAWDEAAAALAAAAKSRSHVIGAALFADLAGGQSFAPLHGLAAALGENRRLDDAIEAASALVGIGHSSGWDMLAGFIAGVTGCLADHR